MLYLTIYILMGVLLSSTLSFPILSDMKILSKTKICQLNPKSEIEYSRGDISSKFRATIGFMTTIGISNIFAESAQAYGAVDVPKKKKSGKVKVLETSLGIKYIDLKEGEGEFPTVGDYIVINYIGFLQNGTEFDSQYAKKNLSFKYGAKQIIPGIENVLEDMRPGGQRSCTIPGKSFNKIIIPPPTPLLV
jgi:hypothetical protein